MRQQLGDHRLLGPIKSDLLNEEAIAELERRYRTAPAKRPAPPSNDARIEQLKGEIGNLADAIAAGILRTSQVLAQRLIAAEGELAGLLAESTRPVVDIARLPVQVADRYKRLVRRTPRGQRRRS